jgi:hypothetical protein
MRTTGVILLVIGVGIVLYGLAVTGLSAGAASEAGGVALERHTPPGNIVPLAFGGVVALIGGLMALFGGRGVLVHTAPGGRPATSA